MTWQDLPIAACVALMTGAAAWDIRSRRIPNMLCAVLALTAMGHSLLGGGSEQLLWGLAHGAAALTVGMVLFSLRVIGGGDAKLYGAGALAFPLPDGLAYLGWTSVAGFVVLLGTIAIGRLTTESPRSLRELRKVEVPYGVAIAAGFTLTALL